MGLDMFLSGKKYIWSNWDDSSKDRKEDGKTIKEITVELGYWRKHPNLHGYIMETFAGGVDECQEIELSAEDIGTIMVAIQEKNLPYTEGFFFGRSDGTDDEAGSDLAIFKEALAWLNAKEKGVGRSVVYRASW